MTQAAMRTQIKPGQLPWRTARGPAVNAIVTPHTPSTTFLSGLHSVLLDNTFRVLAVRFPIMTLVGNEL